MNVTSRQLKAFLLTARHQSFSRAAEQLCITQSGMSMLVRELEEQLGFRLFERTTRRVALSAAGARFLPAAERSLHELEAAAALARRAASAPRRLAIGATPFIAARLLPAALAAYGARDPGLQLELRDGARAQLVAALLAGELDLALGCFLPPAPGLRRTPLHRFALMLAQPPGGAAPLARAPRWDDLAGRRLLGGPPESPLQQLIERQLQRLRRRPAPAMPLSYVETQIALVEAGAGCAVLPSFCLAACRERKVALQPLRDPEVPVDLEQVARAGHEPPAAAELGAFLAQCAARWAAPWPAAALERVA